MHWTENLRKIQKQIEILRECRVGNEARVELSKCHVLVCETQEICEQSGVRGGWIGRERVEDGVMRGTHCFLVQISSIRRGQCISDVVLKSVWIKHTHTHRCTCSLTNILMEP